MHIADSKKLKTCIGQNVFVVSLRYGSLRASDYGKLDSVNESNNIILALVPFGDTIIPFNNGKDKILKVYSKEGYIVYDNEGKK